MKCWLCGQLVTPFKLRICWRPQASCERRRMVSRFPVRARRRAWPLREDLVWWRLAQRPHASPLASNTSSPCPSARNFHPRVSRPLIRLEAQRQPPKELLRAPCCSSGAGWPDTLASSLLQRERSRLVPDFALSLKRESATENDACDKQTENKTHVHAVFHGARRGLSGVVAFGLSFLAER